MLQQHLHLASAHYGLASCILHLASAHYTISVAYVAVALASCISTLRSCILHLASAHYGLSSSCCSSTCILQQHTTVSIAYVAAALASAHYRLSSSSYRLGNASQKVATSQFAQFTSSERCVLVARTLRIFKHSQCEISLTNCLTHIHTYTQYTCARSTHPHTQRRSCKAVATPRCCRPSTITHRHIYTYVQTHTH